MLLGLKLGDVVFLKHENMSLELYLGILSRDIDMFVWATLVGKLTGVERRIVQPR